MIRYWLADKLGLIFAIATALELVAGLSLGMAR